MRRIYRPFILSFIVTISMVVVASAAPGLFEVMEDIPSGLPRIKEVRAVTQGPLHHFFGYYAISPWDATGRYLICLQTDFADRMVKSGEKAGICLIDTESGTVTRIAETSAWNFQQGALAHWRGEAAKSEIVYNDMIDGIPKAVVLDVHSGERRLLLRPITAVAPDGRHAACISFARLNTTRPGYGYPGVEDLYADQPHPKEDGLFVMDLDTGEDRLVASLDDAFHAHPLPKDHEEQTMWFNLIVWSRDSQYVAFLCRCVGLKGGWYTSLFTVKRDGSELRCVIPYAWGASHFDWRDGRQMAVTTRFQAKTGGHVLFTNGEEDHRLLAHEVLKHDGHCHFSRDGQWMVTDSYPIGPNRMQHLYVMNMASEEIALLGRFHQPEIYRGDWRCDLHPRWNHDGTKICIDSTHDGTRQLYVVELAFSDVSEDDGDRWEAAEAHAAQAHEAFSRSRRVMHAWYDHRGLDNWLLPSNLRERIWRPQDAAADLWSFFILAAYLTDREAFGSWIQQTLTDEIRLTTRLGRLPDRYNIDTHTFEHSDINIPDIIFGASEYVKDGLLPVVELMGRSPWFERARDLLDGIFQFAPVETPYGRIPSSSAEINGEMLQSLCRFYFATGDQRYKAWAERIGDAYFLDILPKNNGLPCHDWDFTAGAPRNDVLSLNDHGNEIVLGLSELMALAHACDPVKAGQYLPPMRRMLDTLLETAVNEDGLWVYSIRSTTGEVLNSRTLDTWGYALNAVYTFYMITGETKYRDAVQRALRGINDKPQYRELGGSDDFADAIESGLLLLNRIPEPAGFEWLEAVVPVFLAKQRDDGIVEGWHGDGNYIRTALMYALMKTAGAFVTPWREDVRIGASVEGHALHLHLDASQRWQGCIHLDYPRHGMHFGLPMNYPRLNEYPEWYTVEPTLLYDVTVNGAKRPAMLGTALIEGLPIEVNDEGARILVRPLPGPPYGGRVLRLDAPSSYGGDGACRIPMTLCNNSFRRHDVSLTSSFGIIEPALVSLEPEEHRDIVLIGELKTSANAVIEGVSAQGVHFLHTIQLNYDKGLAGSIVFDDETYKGTRYLWTGKGPIEFKFGVEADKAYTLQLLWGAKNDDRAAVLTINGHTQNIVKGGYDGFEWLDVEIPPVWAKDERIDVRLIADSALGPAAFIAQAKLIVVEE